jgi:hypothetical protein
VDLDLPQRLAGTLQEGLLTGGRACMVPGSRGAPVGNLLDFSSLQATAAGNNPHVKAHATSQ